jgi:peptidoglycan/LPS O-acetylase OafA/YrhL
VVTVVVSVGAVIACATASYFLVERPFLKLKDRFRRSRVEGTTAVLEGRTADTRV